MARLARLPRLYKVMQFSRICKICRRPNSKRKFLKSLNDMLKVSAACERMLVFLMILMIMCHMVSCMWYFVAVVQASPNSWIHSFPELSTDGQFYFVGIYFTITTITTVGYGDISASTNGERFLCSVLMLIGVVSYSYAIGSLSSILTTLDGKTAKLKQKLTILENIRKEFKLNFILYRKMKTAIHFDHTKDLTDKYSLINALPHRLQVELSIVVHQQLIEDIHFFKNKPGQFIAMVAPRLKSMCLPKQDYIFHEKDPIDALYFLRKGTVGLVVRKFPSDLVFIKVQQGSYFGEYDFLISGLNQGKRCFTAKALTDVELLLLHKIDLYRVDQEFKTVTEQLFSRAFARLKQAEEAQARAEKWLRRKVSIDRQTGPKPHSLPFARTRNSQETVTEQISAEFGDSANQILASHEMAIHQQGVNNQDKFQKLADFLKKHCPQLQSGDPSQSPNQYRSLPNRKVSTRNHQSLEKDESSFSSTIGGNEPYSPLNNDQFYMPSFEKQKSKRSPSKSRDRYSQLVSKDSYLHKNQIIQQRAYQLNPHTGKLENSMLTLLNKIGDRLASIEKKMAHKTTSPSIKERAQSFKGIKRMDSEPVKERRISIQEERHPYSSVKLPQGTYKKKKEETLAQRLKIKSELREKIKQDDLPHEQKTDEAWKW